MKISNRILITVGAIYIVASIIIVALVNYEMRQQALLEAESKALILLNRNLATREYFSRELKPKLFSWSAPFRSPDYFEPTWMAPTYVIRRMDHYFRSLEKSKYYYKEIAINARSPENEADIEERAFLEQLNQDPQLIKHTEIWTLNGQPFLVIMHRGERMLESCMPYHFTPERAPGHLVKTYGPTRSFGHRVGEAIHAISIRIPLAEAYGQANRLSWHLSGILLGLLGCVFASKMWISKRWLFDPMTAIRREALEIADSEARLGETIPVPAGRELQDLTTAFNTMSANLRQSHDSLEERVRQRTAELNRLNERLEQDIRKRQQVEESLRAATESFQALIQASPLAIFVLDPEGRVRLWNDAAQRIFGWTVEEAVGQVLPIVPPEKMSEFRGLLQRALDGEPLAGVEARRRRKDGTPIDIKAYTSTLSDPQGRVTGVMAVVADHTLQKQAEEELNAIRERFELALQGADLGTWDWNVETGAVEFNERWAEMLGYLKEEVEPQLRAWEKLVHPDDLPAVTEVLNAHLEGQTHSYETEHRLRHKSGQWVWVLDKGKVIQRDAQGQPRRACGTHQDITQRKRLEESLKKEQQELKLILDSASNIIFYKDRQGKLLRVNKAFAERLNMPEEDFIGKTAFDLYPARIAQGMTNDDQEVFQSGLPKLNIIEQYISASGIRWVQTDKVPIYGESGTVVGLVGFALDITEHKQAQEALRESEERFRSLFDNIDLGITLISPDYRIKMMNPAQERFFHKPAREFIDKECFREFEKRETVCSHCPGKITMATGRKAEMETRGVRDDGSQLPVRIQAFPYFDAKGEITGFIEVVEDITQRLEAEKELKQAQGALAEEAIRRRLLVEQSRDGMIVLDQNGKVYEANQKYAEMLGYSAEEVRELYVWDWDAQWTRKELLEMLRRVDATGDHFETRHRRKDGTFLDVEISTNGTVLGGRKLVFCVCRDISQRKAAERALRESEEKYRLVFEKAPLGILHYDRTSTITDSNEMFAEIIGAPKEKFIGFHMIRQLRDEKMRQAAAASLQGEVGYYEGDYLSVTAGKLTPVRAIFQPLFSLDGVLAGGVAIFEDITERKQAEAALSQNYRELQETAQQLEQSRNMLQLIIESAPVRVFWKDRDSRFMGCNTLFALDAGLSQPEELIGKDDFAMGWREQAEVYRSDDRQVMESRCPKINIIEPQTTPTGDKIWLNTSKVPLQKPNGEVFGVLGVYEDITARKAAEETLRITRESLELALKGADLGTWDWNNKTGAITFNERWAEMLGYRLDEVEPHLRSWENLVHPENLPAAMEVLNAHLEGKTFFYETEYRMRHKSGALVWVLDRGKVIERDAEGKAVRTCGTHLDITERKQAELERLHFSKLESLATLAGGIAHDFNNILTAIMGNISLARLDQYEGQRLADAEDACLQAKALALQLLTFAKGGAPIKELVSVARLITETGAFACRGTNVRCEFSLPENLWAVNADPNQLGQVSHNLVINAIQAMPTGGVMTIQGENLVVEAGSDLPLDPGKYVKISLQDQGLGIPAEYLSRIFDPYFTTKQTGSGLGLATAYSIIKAHQGHITVESTLGKGTTFHLYLPAAEQKIIEQIEADKEVIKGVGRILVMDDEEMVQEILNKMLGHLGYKVMFAGDGAEAIELFTRAQESGEVFDAVILDLTVPGGMGGQAAMEKLLQIDPRVKAIVSSGYSEDPIMAEFARYGFSGVIAKPYRISELSKVLDKVLSRAKGRFS